MPAFVILYSLLRQEQVVNPRRTDSRFILQGSIWHPEQLQNVILPSFVLYDQIQSPLYFQVCIKFISWMTYVTRNMFFISKHNSVIALTTSWNPALSCCQLKTWAAAFTWKHLWHYLFCYEALWLDLHIISLLWMLMTPTVFWVMLYCADTLFFSKMTTGSPKCKVLCSHSLLFHMTVRWPTAYTFFLGEV